MPVCSLAGLLSADTLPYKPEHKRRRGIRDTHYNSQIKKQGGIKFESDAVVFRKRSHFLNDSACEYAFFMY